MPVDRESLKACYSCLCRVIQTIQVRTKRSSDYLDTLAGRWCNHTRVEFVSLDKQELFVVKKRESLCSFYFSISQNKSVCLYENS